MVTRIPLVAVAITVFCVFSYLIPPHTAGNALPGNIGAWWVSLTLGGVAALYISPAKVAATNVSGQFDIGSHRATLDENSA